MKRIFGVIGMLVGFVMTTQQLSAQELFTWRQLTLHTFEEFENVFNGNTDKLNFESKDSLVQAMLNQLPHTPRSKMIKLLLNPAVTEGRESVDALGNYLTQWNIYATPENTVAEANLLYKDAKGKDVPVTLLLQEVSGEHGSRWIVKEAISDIFYVGNPQKVGSIGITNNEIGFMEFGHNAGANPKDIAGDDFEADNVSLFLYLTANGHIKYAHTISTYYYITAGNYRIKVGQIIETDKLVGGWLILEVYDNGKKVFG